MLKFIIKNEGTNSPITFTEEEMRNIFGASLVRATEFLSRNPKMKDFVHYMNEKYHLPEMYSPLVTELLDGKEDLISEKSETFKEAITFFLPHHINKPYYERQSYGEAYHYILFLQELPFKEYFMYNYLPKDERIDNDTHRIVHNVLNDLQKNFKELKKLIDVIRNQIRTNHNAKSPLLREDGFITLVPLLASLFFEIVYGTNITKIDKMKKDPFLQAQLENDLLSEQSDIFAFLIILLNVFISELDALSITVDVPSIDFFNDIISKNQESLFANKSMEKKRKDFYDKNKQKSIEEEDFFSIVENAKKYLKTLPNMDVYAEISKVNDDPEKYKDSFKFPKELKRYKNIFNAYVRHVDEKFRTPQKIFETPVLYRYVDFVVERLRLLPPIFELMDFEFDKTPITKEDSALAEKILLDAFVDMRVCSELSMTIPRSVRKQLTSEMESLKEDLSNPNVLTPVYNMAIQHIQAFKMIQELQFVSNRAGHALHVLDEERNEKLSNKQAYEEKQKSYEATIAQYQATVETLEQKNAVLNKELSQFDALKEQLEASLKKNTELEAKQAEIDYLKEQLQQLEISETLNDEATEIQTTHDGHPFTDDVYRDFVALLDSDKTLLLGGHEKIQHRMQKVLPNALIRDASSLGHDIDSWVKRMDYIILNTHVMSHSMSVSLKNALKRSGVDTPIMYINSRATNERVVFSLIYDEYKRNYKADIHK